MAVYNYTHCIYDEHNRIVGWIINGKNRVDEPFRPFTTSWQLSDFFVNPNIGGYIRLELLNA
jgi:hypothetical protein